MLNHSHFLTLVLTFLVIPAIGFAGAAPKPKYGPAARPIAAPLSRDHGFFSGKGGSAQDFWALIPYYVPQFHPAACSVASVAMAVNAARSGKVLGSEDKLVTQHELLEKISAERWKERILNRTGVNGVGGVTLDQLAVIMKASFEHYGLKNVQIEVVHVEKKDDATIKKIRADLRANEKSDADLIVANFLQSKYTDDADIGHIAPIGAYDAKTKRVLVLDPDREWYEPYWISEKAFADGMATLDKASGRNRGYVKARFDKSR